MSGHTPGPWYVETSMVASGRHMVRIGPMNVEQHLFGTDIPTCAANARLVAAAPDGLAAAERAYVALLQSGQARHSINSQAALAVLRDFIADATGRGYEEVQNEFEAKATGEAA